MARAEMLVISVVVLACLAAGCTSAESYVRPGYDFAKIQKVAILEVLGDVAEETSRNQISDYFAMELVKRGYTVVERQQAQSLLKEQKFQTSGVTPEEDAVKAGRMLNVPAVFIANVAVGQEDFSVTAKMIDVEDASILWIGTGFGSTRQTLTTIGGAALGAAAGLALGGDRTGRTLGGLAGGVGGGIAGYAIAPGMGKQVQKVVVKLADSLPSKVAAASQ